MDRRLKIAESSRVDEAAARTRFFIAGTTMTISLNKPIASCEPSIVA